MRVREIMEKPKKARRGYQAWEVSQASRSQLAGVFPPKFSDFIGHHITFKMGAGEDDPLPQASSFKVVGYFCDPEGLEALIVEVDGTTVRPDGYTYHITWSLDRSKGFKPVSAKYATQGSGWDKIPHGINIHAEAKFF